jgi:hypothetical protein
MPNWVYNYITVTGTQENVDKFKDHIFKKPERFITDEEWNEHQRRFSFHSFITPSEEITDDEYNGTNGWSEGERVGDTAGNWYNWNIANWGCKWDARTPYITENSSESIDIAFETPWGPPDPVFYAMAKQYPDLTFEVRWEEEQGFGAELFGVDGEFSLVKEWDIPGSHADHVEQDKECHCQIDSDQEYWFDDCPGKEGKKVFTVESITKRFIVAYTANEAMEAAKAEEAGYDLPDNTEIKDTLYAEEFRVVDEEKMEEENE